MLPDVSVVDLDTSSNPSTAGVSVTAPVLVPTLISESILHYSVEIRDRLEHRLVTAIEVLSPTNKQGEGREEYLAKRDRVLHSAAHLAGARSPPRRAPPAHE